MTRKLLVRLSLVTLLASITLVACVKDGNACTSIGKTPEVYADPGKVRIYSDVNEAPTGSITLAGGRTVTVGSSAQICTDGAAGFTEVKVAQLTFQVRAETGTVTLDRLDAAWARLELEEHSSGSLDVRAGEVTDLLVLDTDRRSTGGITVQGAAESAHITVHGSGVAEIHRVCGTLLEVVNEGPGNAVVRRGEVTILRLFVSDRGSTTYSGRALNSRLTISGVASGAITVADAGDAPVIEGPDAQIRLGNEEPALCAR